MPFRASRKKSSFRIPIPTEEKEQIAFVKWCRLFRLTKAPYCGQPLIFYHVPNGGSRNALEGAKFKRMGVSSGVPDLCFPMPSGAYHGLYIELKRKTGGVLSDTQRIWLSNLSLLGYATAVCAGVDEAIAVIKRYFRE